MDLEQGTLSFMRINEELLERKSIGSGFGKPRLTAVVSRRCDHGSGTGYTQPHEDK
jgi:hypothetical protein